MIETYLVLGLCVMQVLDGWSTYYALRFRFLRDGFYVTRWLLEHLGLYWGFVVAKGAPIAVVVYMVQDGSYLGDAIVIWGLFVFYVAILTNNFRLLIAGR